MHGGRPDVQERNNEHMAREKILVVDDEAMIRWTLTEALRGWGYEPIEAGTVAGALSAFEGERPTAVLLDINLPDGSGLDVLGEIKSRQPQAVVIMITANVMVDDTLAALRGGAYDFIGKPINLNELQITIRNGIEAGKLRKEVSRIQRERTREFSFEQIIGESAVMQKMIALARKVAESEASSVLLQGESGRARIWWRRRSITARAAVTAPSWRSTVRRFRRRSSKASYSVTRRARSPMP